MTCNIVLTVDGAHPNNLPDLVAGTILKATFKCAVLGTLTSLSITDPGRLVTLGTPSTTGNDSTVTITTANCGCTTLIVSAVLSSGETIKHRVSLRVISQDELLGSDYGG